MNFNPNKWNTVDDNKKNQLNNKLIDHEYKRKDNIEFKLGDTDIKLKYSSPDFSYLFKMLFKKPASFEPSIGNLNILINLRKIDELIIENSSDTYSTKDILTKDWQIFFWTIKNINFRSSISLEEKIIFLEEDPLTSKGILQLAHEIGHFEQDQILSKEEKKIRENIRVGLNLGIVDNESKGIIIQEERTAWAYALNHFRHFNKDLNISNNDIEETVHRECLKSYEENIENLNN